MEQSTAQRRLVKSPPELWAEISSEEHLGRHLAEFGEIRITRADAETTVAWEGDRASGTVELAPAGWGTKVVLTATPVAEEAAAAPVAAETAAEPEPEPEPQPEPIAAAPTPPPATRPAPVRARRGLLARLLRRWTAPRRAAEIPAPGPPVHDPSPPTPAPDPSPPGPGPAPSPTPPPPDPVPPAPDPDPTPPPSIKAAAPELEADPDREPTPPSSIEATAPELEADPDPTPPPSIEATAPELDPDQIVAILTRVLDDLGAAHHRATYFAPLT